MKRRDMFSLLRGGTAAFLLGKYGLPDPANTDHKLLTISDVTLKPSESIVVFWTEVSNGPDGPKYQWVADETTRTPFKKGEPWRTTTGETIEETL